MAVCVCDIYNAYNPVAYILCVENVFPHNKEHCIFHAVPVCALWYKQLNALYSSWQSVHQTAWSYTYLRED